MYAYENKHNSILSKLQESLNNVSKTLIIMSLNVYFILSMYFTIATMNLFYLQE